MSRSIEHPETIEPAEVDLLLGLLHSADPAMRDDFACTTLSDLVTSEDTAPPVISRIVDQCTRALAAPLAADDGSVLGRSYSCLVLNAVLEADLSRPVLLADEWAAITGAIVRWWQAEPDERGYDPDLGWVHCLAHGADTILLASQSRHADATFRAECLTIIGRKLASTTRVFEGYEDLRCALAFSAAVFGGVDDNALARVSDVVQPVLSPAPGTPQWAAKVNLTSFLARLHVLWTVGVAPCPPGPLGWLTEILALSDDFGALAQPGRPESPRDRSGNRCDDFDLPRAALSCANVRR